MTHETLYISAAAYDEIAAKLQGADYSGRVAVSADGGVSLDMSGLVLTRALQAGPPGPPLMEGPPIHIWTWVDDHGCTRVQFEEPAPLFGATAYILLSEHDRMTDCGL